MAFEEIVDLTITVQNPIITRVGFGIALIMSAEAVGKFSGASKLYGSIDELIDDGFSTTGITYTLASKLQGQSPAPSNFMVAKRTNSGDFTHALDLIVQPGNVADVYSAKINDIEYEYERLDGYTDAEVAAEFADLVSGDTSLTVSVVDETISIEANDTGTYIDVSSVNLFSIKDQSVTTPGALALDLSEALSYDDSFYAVLLDLKSEDQILEGAEWVESRRRILFVDSQDSDLYDQGVTDDIGSQLKDLSYANTVISYHHVVGGGFDAGWLGKGITYEPGSYNWCHKVISGVAVSNLSDSQKATLRAKRVNYYTDVIGSGHTWNGITPSGEFIDTVSLVHFLYARIQEEVLSVLKSNIRIPYTDKGIAIITAAVLGVLRRKIGSGIAASPAPEVNAPLVRDIPTADKQARHVPGITFKALLEGAINSVEIKGTLSVDENLFA